MSIKGKLMLGIALFLGVTQVAGNLNKSSINESFDRDAVIIKTEEFGAGDKISRRDMQYAFARVPKELLEEMALARKELEEIKSKGGNEEVLKRAHDRYGSALIAVKGNMDESISNMGLPVSVKANSDKPGLC